MSRERTPEEKLWNVGFGARVERARKRLGLSQERLGGMLPWAEGQQTVSKYERGRSTPSPFRLAALAEALETTVADLLGGRPSNQVAEPEGVFLTLETDLVQTLTRLDISARQEVLAFARRLVDKSQPSGSGG